MSKNEDTIERTPEYEAFIQDLREFHKQKGYIDYWITVREGGKGCNAMSRTSLQAEPVLGRKRLDLLKFYKLVLAAGGFEQVRNVRQGRVRERKEHIERKRLYFQVTKKRSWKHIGENFRLPSTCTNSAYILKGLYIRNLVSMITASKR